VLAGQRGELERESREDEGPDQQSKAVCWSGVPQALLIRARSAVCPTWTGPGRKTAQARAGFSRSGASDNPSVHHPPSQESFPSETASFFF